ncbi:MerR family transcriptional regulator [Mesorhizobium sp.]|uniref:MerR family transcriptional regulator n=1 Tax=Mesorhizobium sp. TaxID=1871066 RepID=UPI0025EEF7AC|nr:MerR family transcriptional regulator [Mesorhizobium sp.]
MAELSAQSGVPIPTIRFYMREGLVPAGQLTSPNQAVYDETHIRALKLVRTLIEVGGLPIASVREVLAFIDAKGGDLYATMGGVQYALTTRREAPEDAMLRNARAVVNALIKSRKWQVREDNPARESLAHALATLERLDQDDVAAKLNIYADAAASLAKKEVADLLKRDTVEAISQGVIAYDVLGDAMLSALRRLAQEDEVTMRLKPL